VSHCGPCLFRLSLALAVEEAIKWRGRLDGHETLVARLIDEGPPLWRPSTASPHPETLRICRRPLGAKAVLRPGAVAFAAPRLLQNPPGVDPRSPKRDAGRDTRCARKKPVALEKPKTVRLMEVNLEARRAGEVLVNQGDGDLPQRTSSPCQDADPEGLFPSILGHEGAGIVMEVGEGVTESEAGDHSSPHAYPECAQCFSCLSAKPTCAPRSETPTAQGLNAGRHKPFSMPMDADLHYMGCSTFANQTVMTEIALPSAQGTFRSEKICYMACGVTNRDRVGHQTPQESRSVPGGGSSARRDGLNVIQGLRRGRDKNHRRRSE